MAASRVFFYWARGERGAVYGALTRGKRVGMIYLDLVDFHNIEQIYVIGVCSRILRRAKGLLRSVALRHLTSNKVLEVSSYGDDFFLFFLSLQSSVFTVKELVSLATKVRQNLAESLNVEFLPLLGQELRLSLGFAYLEPSGGVGPERLVYSAIKEASRVSKEGLDEEYLQLSAQLKDIIARRDIKVVYQPLVSLKSGKIAAFEALARGPEGTSLALPSRLFSLAQENGILYSLERIARELAISSIGSLAAGQKLFINIDPQVIHDPSFATGETKRILEEKGLVPQNVVFEITERTAITDYATFRRALEHYRRQGYLIAIDDAGAGYSSLQSIAELRPDFIKLDMSLVREIHLSKVKEALLESLVLFGERINARLIAEGIENEDELRVVIQLGVPFGQGFYLARPAYPPPGIAPEALGFLEYSSFEIPRALSLHGDGAAAPVGSISEKVYVVGPQETTGRVFALMEADSRIASVIVAAGECPCGLVMRDKLYSLMATRYGPSLYFERPITRVMQHPFIVDADMPLDVVSRLAMERSGDEIYDDIVVVMNGIYKGNVSLRLLLDNLTQIQVKAARYANPLTGLPGNLSIEEQIQNHLKRGNDFALIYADLDNFKAFNDHYGFEQGDMAIKFLAQLLLEEVNTQ